jgi:hypothetical protein
MRMARAAIVFLLFVGGSVAQDQQYFISTYAGGGPLPVRVAGNNLAIDWNSKDWQSTRPATCTSRA